MKRILEAKRSSILTRRDWLHTLEAAFVLFLILALLWGLASLPATGAP